MRKIKNIVVIIMIISMMCILMTSCGEEAIVEPDTEAGYSVIFGDNLQYDTSLDVNSGENITITFWFPTDVEEICEEYIDKYQDIHENVKFSTKSYSWDKYWTELESALGKGTGPDIFWMNSAYNNNLISYAQPLSTSVFPEKSLKKDFRNYDAHEIDGDIYYVDLAYTSFVVMYNKDMWADAGLTENDIPKTWEEFETVARKLTITDASGNITVSGFDFNGDNNFVNLVTILNYQSGQTQFTEDSTQTYFSSDITIDNMEYLKDYITYKISDYTQTANRDALGAGKTAMICDWTWVYLYLSEVYPDIDVGVFALPQKSDSWASQMMYSDVSPCISSNTSDTESAVCEDFVKFLLCYDNFIKDYSLQNQLYPSKYSLDNDFEILADPVLSALYANIDKSVLTVPASAEIEYIKMYYIQNMYLSGTMTASSSAIKASSECRVALLYFDFDSLESKYAYYFMLNKE